MSFAVVFTYSFDHDVAVYLFETENEAKEFLTGSFEEEVKMYQEDGWELDVELSSNKRFARITRIVQDDDNETLEIRLGAVYQ